MTSGRPSISRTGAGGVASAAALDLAVWVRERSPGIAERWAQGLLAAGEAWSGANEVVLRPFCRGLVSFLPGLLSAGRPDILPMWSECAELFGSVAARRGLSVGEVIEEFQLLREVVLRMMFEQPSPGLPGQVPMREALLLNRTLDIGVTQASVGHADLLFFSLLKGSGAVEPMDGDELQEVLDQVALLRDEARRTVRHVARTGAK